jgi:RNA polymerase sigma-70 factor (ECF subfamily)
VSLIASPETMPSDSELTRSAQCGDVAALGLLLARHQADLRAVALSVLGYGPDAEDAVQEAALVALRRIGDVRDPGSVGAWLRMIVRNACRMRLRARNGIQLTDRLDPRSDVPSPEEVLDRHALQDWVWHAIEELTPTLALPLMLRHFSGISSYEEIAAACEVPLGTVRSRLNQARSKLSAALLATADKAHDDAATLTALRGREAVETLATAERGAFAEVAAERWAPTFEIVGGAGERGGRELALAGMDGDLTAGVRQRFVNAVASRQVTIWEMDLINPTDDPEHCPPAVIWVQTLHAGQVTRLRLFHPERPRPSR